MATVCVSALLSIDVVFAQQKPTTAQTSTQKSLSDIDAVDAYTFAKDVAEVNQNDPVFKALENAHNKQFGEGNEADGELKAGNYVQCGASLCNLDTHFCYKETNYWSTGQGGSISNCVCSDKELPLKGENNSAYSGVTRSLMTMGCSSFTNQRGSTYKQYLTMTGADGKSYQIHIGDTISIQYNNESNDATRGCEVLPVKLYNYRKCFFCPLIGVIYDGSAKITDVAFAKMAGAFSVLLASAKGLLRARNRCCRARRLRPGWRSGGRPAHISKIQVSYSRRELQSGKRLQKRLAGLLIPAWREGHPAAKSLRTTVFACPANRVREAWWKFCRNLFVFQSFLFFLLFSRTATHSVTHYVLRKRPAVIP